MTDPSKANNHFRPSDFLNGLFLGGLLGASYVYFFHHPKGKKVLNQILAHKDEIIEEIKAELDKLRQQDKKPQSVKKIAGSTRRRIKDLLSTRPRVPYPNLSDQK